MEPIPQPFEIVDAPLSGACGVAVKGELDLAAVPSFQIAVDTAIRESVGVFVLDLCDVEFIDSSGLRVLLRARALLARDERDLAIVCPPGAARRVFEMAGIFDLLILFSTRDEAAAALVPAG